MMEYFKSGGHEVNFAGDGISKKGLLSSALFIRIPMRVVSYIINKKNINGVLSQNLVLSLPNFIFWMLYSWDGPNWAFYVNVFSALMNLVWVCLLIWFSYAATRRSTSFATFVLLGCVGAATAFSMSFVRGVELHHGRIGFFAMAYNIGMNLFFALDLGINGAQMNKWFCITAIVLFIRSVCWAAYACWLDSTDVCLFLAHFSGLLLSIFQISWYHLHPEVMPHHSPASANVHSPQSVDVGGLD